MHPCYIYVDMITVDESLLNLYLFVLL